MRKLLFKRTFAGRVSAYIIALIMIVFCVVMVSFYKVAREKIIDSSMRHAAGMLTNMSQQIGLVSDSEKIETRLLERALL